MSRKRSQSRYYALQALYQWQMTGQNIADIEQQFLSAPESKSFDVGYFRDILHGVPAHLRALDESLGAVLDRSIANVDPVERAILRIGAYELLYHPEVPYRVAINESVELAKIFGAEKGHRYVNGVLDRMAKSVRQTEMGNVV